MGLRREGRGSPRRLARCRACGEGRLRWNAYPAERAGRRAAEPETGSRIGWDEYAEYTVDPREGIIDVAIGPIDEEEAAAALILSVLPLILPLVGLEPLHGAALTLAPPEPRCLCSV